MMVVTTPHMSATDQEVNVTCSSEVLFSHKSDHPDCYVHIKSTMKSHKQGCQTNPMHLVCIKVLYILFFLNTC